MHRLIRSLAVLSALVALSFSVAAAQPSLTRRDATGPVTVVATLLEAPAPTTPLKVRVVLDTHSVPLDAIVLEEAVRLKTAAGDVAATAVNAAEGSGHHRSAVFVFPPAGEGPIRIVVKNVGGIAERLLTWERPAGR